MLIVYDTTLKRPACAILQAAFGGDAHIASRFPLETWLINPTDDMKLYKISEQQLDQLIMITGEKHETRTKL